MLKRPDQGSKLGKPAGMGFSSVKAPPVLPLVKSSVPIPNIQPAGPALDDDEEMVDLD